MNKIKYYRLMQDRQLKDLQVDTGLSLGHLSHLENGSREPSKSSMEALAKALGKSVQQVFYDEYTPDEINFLHSKGVALEYSSGRVSGFVEGGVVNV